MEAPSRILCLFILCFLTGPALSQFGDKFPLNATTEAPKGLFMVDLDNDGDKDIISAADIEHKLSWFENLGSGEYGLQRYIDYNLRNTRTAWAADLDADGDNDVVSASHIDDQVVWYENLGYGNFSPKTIISILANGPSSVKTGDLDGDGDQDVISSSDVDDEISWFKNTGDGTFGPQLIISGATANTGIFDIKCTDIDDDGDIDVLAADESDEEISWFENSGIGTFSGEQFISGYTAAVHDVDACDLDGDGDKDVIAGSFSGDYLSWHENLGGGTFGLEQTIGSGADGFYAIDHDDMDGDGDEDVVCVSIVENTLAWYENLGGTFGAEQVILAGLVGMWGLVTEDMDGDGDFDVLVCASDENAVVWIENIGGGLFDPVHHQLSKTSVHSLLHAADMNNDGYDELIAFISGGESELMIYRNFTGKVAFQDTISTFNLGNVEGMGSGDLDGDGLPDFVVSSTIANIIYWYKNLGDLNFGPPQVLSSAFLNPSGLEVSDFDLDGDNDVVAANYGFSSVGWCENDGTGFFTYHEIGSLIDGATDVASCDLESDGDLDVFVTSAFDNQLLLYRNLGSEVFAPVILIGSGLGAAVDVHAKDLDNDADFDVLVTCAGELTISWYENLGGISFGPEQMITAAMSGNKHCSVVDIDGDADEDILTITNSFGDQVTWFENLGGGSFSAEHYIDSVTTGYDVVPWDFDNDGDLDVATAYFHYEGHRAACHTNYYTSNLQVNGTLYYDANENGVQDTLEPGLNSISVISDPESLFSFTDPSGEYHMTFNESPGTYVIAPEILTGWSITSDSLDYTITIDTVFTILDSMDFGFFPSVIVDEVKPELTGAFAKCNDTVNYWLGFTNTGTTIVGGVVHLQLDDDLIYIASAVVPDSIVGGDIYWSFDSLFFFEAGLINIQVQMPDFTSIGDTVYSALTASAMDGSVLLYEATDTLKQVVECAYDPNDKITEPAGIGAMGYIPATTSSLDYTVRFQNTGTDTAHHIVIKDQLDVNLIWSTFKPLGSSHDVEIVVDADGLVKFTFTNIMLPDSGTNEIASHGFAKYRINLVSGLPHGTSIYNTASIYFDLNPSIITNTKINTLDSNTNVGLPPDSFESDFVIHPNPANSKIFIRVLNDIPHQFSVSMCDLRGVEVVRETSISSGENEVDIDKLDDGIYILHITDDQNARVVLKQRVVVY